MIKVINVSLYNKKIILFYKQKQDEKFILPKYIIKEYNITEEQLNNLYDVINDDTYKCSTIYTNKLEIIRINSDIIKNTKHLLQCISHEALHATFDIANIIGLKYNYKSEEAFTYLLDYIVGEITDILKKEIEYFIARDNLNKNKFFNDKSKR